MGLVGSRTVSGTDHRHTASSVAAVVCVTRTVERRNRGVNGCSTSGLHCTMQSDISWASWFAFGSAEVAAILGDANLVQWASTNQTISRAADELRTGA